MVIILYMGKNTAQNINNGAMALSEEETCHSVVCKHCKVSLCLDATQCLDGKSNYNPDSFFFCCYYQMHNF